VHVAELEFRQRSLARRAATGDVAARGALASVTAELEQAYRSLTALAAALGLDPDALLVSVAPAAHSGTSWPAPPQPSPPEREGVCFSWPDGEEVWFSNTNAHGAYVPDDADRRRLHMGPRWVYRRLRPAGRVLCLAPPLRGEPDPWRTAGRTVLVGPPWLVQGAWVLPVPAAALAAAGAALGGAPGTVAGWALAAAVVALWWPLRLGVRAAVLGLPLVVSAPVCTSVAVAVAAVPAVAARGVAPLVVIVPLAVGTAALAWLLAWRGVLARAAAPVSRRWSRAVSRLVRRPTGRGPGA
jgi:hypothetical protein